MASKAVPASLIGKFREFNRQHSRLIGTLENGYLGTDLTLQEARVLYEIAKAPRCSQTEIREKTGMDQAFVSRILARLGRSGLLEKVVSATDGRSREFSLSEKGRRRFREIDRRADQLAGRVLGPLLPEARQRVEAALTTLQAHIHGQAASGFVIREEQVGDLGWTFYRQAVVYREEFGYSPVFEKYVSEGLAPFLHNRDLKRDRLWVAEMDGEKVGFIAVHHADDRPSWAKLRWFLVEKEARGQGLGRALLERALAFCRDAGYKGIFLWTVSDLDGARRQYERAGLQLAEEKEGCEWAPWGKEQRWELRL